MAYTSGTTMEDRGLRDVERWRDKIEVRLDNRQVFFLFFGSALVACLLFVLGVIVGKRLESRGRAVSPEIEDPLALLDKVATTPRPGQAGVTFPQALFGNEAKTGAGDKHAKKNAGAGHESAASKPATVALRENKPLESSPKAAGLASKPAKPEGKPATTPAEAKTAERSAKAKPADGKTAESKALAGKTVASKAVAGKVSGTKPGDVQPTESKEAKAAPIPTIATGGDGKSKGHFTLQLSSFQTKAEAEAFAQKFAGERPYLVVSNIPGKGTWYRVRVGDFASSKDALAAKESFEKKHSVIAYVAQR